MIQAMYNGVSGLRAHKTQMDVISNNIANINTVGFKSSRVTFREVLSQTIRGASAPASGGRGGINPMQIGLGVSVGSIDVSQIQGSLLPTGKPTDIAIEGNGFLILSDGQGKYYTRDGSFELDSEGSIVSSGSGMRVLGWSANPSTGVIDDSATVSPSSGIRVPIGQTAVARATVNLSLGGNLDAGTAEDGTYTVGAQIYDSLGTPHSVNVTFTKTANPSEWTWEATSPDAAGGTTAGSGTITFDENGRNTATSGSLSLTLADALGATNPVDMTLSLDTMTQLTGESTAKATYQDGLPLGVLDGFSIGKDGVIFGSFTNGMTQRIGRIALAQFSNPSGLGKVGNNVWAETGNSGVPQVGQPGTGSLGNTTAGFLESSNADLSTEFANMIVSQRGFQASSRIITTSDEILNELVQLKR